MHSSTSNSDPALKWPEDYWQRPIPSAHWRAVGLLTLLLVTLFLGIWESYWRSEGYTPSFENTKDLWAHARAKVGQDGPRDTVVIGSSRILFGFDLDMWQQANLGPRPLMLPLVGTSPIPVLHDLADDPSFTGTLICGVTEVVFFVPAPAPPAKESAEFVQYAKSWSPTARASLFLSVPIESALASLNLEDLSLDALLKRWLPLANRPGTRVPPQFPPYFASIDFDRRNKMWSRTETDPALQHKVQQIWLPLIKIAPPFAGEGLTALLEGVKSDVAKIRARGGRVIFVRYPSTGEFLEIERELWPRADYWDRLLAVTGAPGIHYEDYPELSGFQCPEWSHLTRADAVTFTRNLAPLVRAKLAP